MGYHVAPDAWGSMMCPYDQASMFAAKPEQLAPTYDGNTKVEWDTCAWRPDTEHA
jgi:hypothetical protein